MKFDIKTLLPHIIAVLLFITISCVYFMPQFQNKSLRQGDTQQFQGMASEVVKYHKKGDEILWTNSMFGGMPTYQISARQNNNLNKHLAAASRLWIFPRPSGYFIGGMIAFYISFLILGINPWVALLGGLSFAFTTNNLVLFEAGHNSKVAVLMTSILVIAGVVKLFRKKYILGAIAFTAGLAISVFGNHYQMTYYLAIALGIYFLIASIDLILKKDFKALGIIVGLLLLGTLLTVGSSASKLWTTYEYASETMRGKPILKKTKTTVDPNNSSESEGLAWNYAMNWSNGFNDLMAMYIPGVTGGGSSEPIAKDSEVNKVMRKRNLRPLEAAPLYWGKLPFTSGPQYIGAISFFLFFLSLFVIKPHMRIWAILALIVTALISMGSQAEWLNRFLYNNLPMFNKFRSPSSATSITALIVPFIAFIGLAKIISKEYVEEHRAKLKRAVIIVTATLSAICLFYVILGPMFYDFESSSDQRYAQQLPELVNAFISERVSLMRGDALRSLLLTVLAGGTIYLFLIKKIKTPIVIVALSILMLFDLLGVGKRYINYDSFERTAKIKNSLKERPVDTQILQDKTLHYRVHDVTSPSGPYNNTTASLFHKTVGGYHAAKLQRIQDIIDMYLAKGEQKVFDMLNTKYFITGQPGQEKAQQNPNAYGNAWFVNSIAEVKTNREEIEAIKPTDVKNTAIVHQSEKSKLTLSNYGKGTIELSDYHPDRMVYKSNNSTNGLAVFSEVFYGPDKGWKAYIDGQETPIIRTNYLLRGLEIPAGQHEVVFEFKPKSYYTGELISLICSLIIVLGVLYGLYVGLFKKKEDA